MDQPLIPTGLLERRASPRATTSELTIRVGRVRPGHDVHVVDLSREGALVEGEVRMVPGAAMVLQIGTPGRCVVVSCRVLRCRVAALGGARRVRYRSALKFERSLEGVQDHNLVE